MRNYRSGTAIIRAAEQLISHNPHPLPVAAMHPCATIQGALHRHECASPEQEAVFIADQIELQLGGISHRSLDRFDHTGAVTVSFRDIGVLYRTSRQAETIGNVLTERGIPFQLVDLEAYYTKGDCRLLYYLDAAARRNGRTQPPSLSPEPGAGDWRTYPADGAIASESLRPYTRTFPVRLEFHWRGELALPLNTFAPCIRGYGSCAEAQPVEVILRTLIDYYQLDPQKAELKRLRDLALTFDCSLPAFAVQLEKFSDSVVYDARAEAVTLSTLHAAKGLEFPVVFIAGLEEGLLPLTPRQTLRSEAFQEHLEEERRLFYVGITRAIATLYLTWCQSRSVFGARAESRNPSPLLAELPQASFSPPPESLHPVKRKPIRHQLSLFP